jgi:carbamoyltransferase
MPTKPTVILGITYGHGDSSAALIIEGCLIAAAEEERFNRVKHYALFPHQAIAYCLHHAKIQPSDVQVVALPRQPRAHFRKKLKMFWKHPHLFRGRRNHRTAPEDHESFRKQMKIAGLNKARIARIEHHLAHQLSTRFLASNDDVAFLSFDGLGDFTSTAIGRPQGNGVEILDRLHYPHSLGYFYTAMSMYLGFPYYGDEFKVMGLSSYGKPRYLNCLRELVRENEDFGFQLNLEAFPLLKEPMQFYVEKGQPKVEPFYNRALLTHIIGLPQRKPKDLLGEEHWDLAKSVQLRFEEVANHLVTKAYDKVPAHTLALSGGCAHNSVWVGKLLEHSKYKHVVVAPASHDAGLAVGAAIGVADMKVLPEGGHWALLGIDYAETPEHEPENLPFEYKSRDFIDERALIDWMVQELTQKKLIGLFRGRMEFGPRALGNRSIIADPRWSEMKERLNERVKHREWFRPFAAMVLYEQQDSWFKGSFHCPTMEAVFEVLEEQRHRIPGVVHVDKTCRIQSVEKETQPFQWHLLEAFRKKTGVPMLINTSFNDSEPIVATRKDAWNCFAHCELDHLVIGARAYSRVRQPVALTA